MRCSKKPLHRDRPPVYLHLIFEISSLTRFFFNFKLEKKNEFETNSIFWSSSNLIFTACVACKNQFRNQIDFLNLIFWNGKKIKWHLIFQKSSGDRQGVWLVQIFVEGWNLRQTVKRKVEVLSYLYQRVAWLRTDYNMLLETRIWFLRRLSKSRFRDSTQPSVLKVS